MCVACISEKKDNIKNSNDKKNGGKNHIHMVTMQTSRTDTLFSPTKELLPVFKVNPRQYGWSVAIHTYDNDGA